MCKAVEDYAKEYAADQINKALIEGEIKGEIKGKIKMVKNMIDLGYKKSEALKCAGLDAKTYNKYLAEQ